MLGLDMRQASTLLEDKSPRRELRRDLDTPLSADKGRIELAPFGEEPFSFSNVSACFHAPFVCRQFQALLMVIRLTQ